MIECWGNASKKCKGILLILTGTILALHTMGILKEGLGVIIILVSIAMIAQGIIMCNLHQEIIKLFKRNRE